MKPVHTILEASKQEYDLMVWNIFLNWAGLYAKDRLTLQKMITSKQIANWFNAEYLKLIYEFKKVVEPYEQLDAKSKRKLYVEIVTKVYEHYPKPLIQECKATKIINQSYNLN
ncbi:hypothetical protein [Tenacibaculum aestuarii]|uniref:hypothetical protein n=1 Tax=Tenacibaculum aestuarii TaxID=362781 RepID=UPI0038938AD3